MESRTEGNLVASTVLLQDVESFTRSTQTDGADREDCDTRATWQRHSNTISGKPELIYGVVIAHYNSTSVT